MNNGLAKSNSDSIHVSPRKAMILSAAIPGAGQIYVRKPLKAILFAGGEAYCIRQIVYWNKVDNYVEQTIAHVGQNEWENMEIEQQIDTVQAVTGYALDREPWKPEEIRNKTYWWILGIHIVSMLDAYVDAHLINFPEGKIELSSFAGRNTFGINCSIKF